jgi:ribonuclease BN (tRNA processing enzyme)
MAPSKKKTATESSSAKAKKKTPAKRKSTKRDATKSNATKRTASKRAKKKREGHSQVVMLGTGTPGPDPDRFGPSLAIVVNYQPYLVDFGAGVVRRAAAAYEKGVHGLAPHLLTRAFLTHLHSDHTVGYPDLILTPWVSGRDEKLEVYGPTGIRSMTDHILAAYEADIDQRLHGLEPANEIGYQVNAHEIQPGLIYEDDNVEVEAFSVTHGTFEAYGFKFICPDRTIVVSGDTCKHENVAQAAKGCDVLVHEVCSGIGVEFRSDVWRTYHSTYHTLAHELAEIANEARPGLLVLTHQLFQGVSEAELLMEIRSTYNGAVVSGKDLDIF